jgi:hypothetical protein
MTFEVRNPEVEAKLKQIGDRLRKAVDEVPGYGFALLIFSYGPNGNMFYTSNAQRQSIINAMREFIARAEEN